ncbi:hypothetical protein BJY04DRAFT_156221 [Aspergillus karnatakaensis]|uniref:uncharacterized protein n=1 Tax=Aspergillus karnatakaensis TaxID=1810916 RepID=UPI003CCDECE1
MLDHSSSNSQPHQMDRHDSCVCIKYIRAKTRPNICLSGAADGADLYWGQCATLADHDLIHWTFPGHRTQAPETQIVRLSDEELKLGTEALNNAATVLNKFPPSRPTVTRLLLRNYYQVAWSESCYAVTVIGDNPGGTAWATTMFAQLHPGNENLYLFDMERNGWFQWRENEWVGIESPPRPRGVWTGIGSRDLKENGKNAIMALLGVEVSEE